MAQFDRHTNNFTRRVSHQSCNSSSGQALTRHRGHAERNTRRARTHSAPPCGPRCRLTTQQSRIALRAERVARPRAGRSREREAGAGPRAPAVAPADMAAGAERPREKRSCGTHRSLARSPSPLASGRPGPRRRTAGFPVRAARPRAAARPRRRAAPAWGRVRRRARNGATHRCARPRPRSGQVFSSAGSGAGRGPEGRLHGRR